MNETKIRADERAKVNAEWVVWLHEFRKLWEQYEEIEYYEPEKHKLRITICEKLNDMLNPQRTTQGSGHQNRRGENKTHTICQHCGSVDGCLSECRKAEKVLEGKHDH